MAGWGRRPTSQTPVTTTTNVKHFADPSGAARTCLNDIMQVIAAMKVSSQKLGSAADSLRLRRVAQTHLQRGQEACDRIDAAMRILRSGEEVATVYTSKLLRDCDDAKRSFNTSKASYRDRLKVCPVPGDASHRSGVGLHPDIKDQAQTYAQAHRQAIGTRISEAVNLEIALAEERAEATQGVLASAIELKDMAADLGELVDGQGEQLEEMAENVDTARASVQQGNQNMEDAIWYQSSNRNLMMLLCCVGMIIVGAIVGPVVWATTRKR